MTRRRAVLLPVVLVALLALAGCRTAPRDVGPIAVSLGPGAVAGWEHYDGLEKPDYFALSEDGRAYGYTFCGVAGCLNDPASNRRKRAIKHCESKRDGVRCRLFAKQRQIVWNGSVDMSATPVKAENAIETLRRGKAKTALFRWDGLLQEARAPVVLTGGQGGTAGAVAVLPKPIGRCVIALSFESRSGGAWRALCGEERAASGAFTISEDGKTATGQGADRQGRAVWYRIGR